MINTKRLLRGLAAAAMVVESIAAFFWLRRRRRLARQLDTSEAVVDAAGEIMAQVAQQAERQAAHADRGLRRRVYRLRRSVRAWYLRAMESARNRGQLRWRPGPQDHA